MFQLLVVVSLITLTLVAADHSLTFCNRSCFYPDHSRNIFSSGDKVFYQPSYNLIDDSIENLRIIVPSFSHEPTPTTKPTHHHKMSGPEIAVVAVISLFLFVVVVISIVILASKLAKKLRANQQYQPIV